MGATIKANLIISESKDYKIKNSEIQQTTSQWIQCKLNL